jgi:DNA-binding response OmpR family regulator
MRILVVEDEALIAMMLEDMLVDLGHEVIEVAGSVRRALEVIGARAREIEAAVVDANLGGQSALPVVAALGEAGVPALLASGYEPAELRRLGFDHAGLRKPYRQTEVERALADL